MQAVSMQAVSMQAVSMQAVSMQAVSMQAVSMHDRDRIRFAVVVLLNSCLRLAVMIVCYE
jgi:hypothetical protein